ncbi:hypothetical protein [Ruegeria sp. HKCCD7318]|uniref:hypothetical protein n=1 Tax=Ruegeria sp. HKCCD7318 TaxID=2683014 RepID=UPI001490A749|nr:hypothetical protein [Ruegeria sp. HKCCD7318]NOE36217.1 hypothetical protein [Ruegeria sp. HKCCD7318]
MTEAAKLMASTRSMEDGTSPDGRIIFDIISRSQVELVVDNRQILINAELGENQEGKELFALYSPIKTWADGAKLTSDEEREAIRLSLMSLDYWGYIAQHGGSE